MTDDNSDLVEIYNQEYVNNYHQESGQRYTNILSNIDFSENDSVIDLGCGSGFLYERIQGRIGNYKGIDFSEEFIKVCKEKFPDRKEDFVCADITKYCADKDNTFTKAFMLDFTEHVYDKELLEIFDAALKTLNAGGSLYIHTPNKDYILEILKDKGILKQVTGHIAVRNDKEYQKLLEQSGFNKIETIFLPHYNFLSKLHFLSKLPLVGKYFRARLLIKATK